MADLNDDIKKYLSGELTPAEMHALEKKALDDPFLEDALEGATQLESNAYESDLRNLDTALTERVSRKSGKVIPLWVWPARIAAGLILVALSTFVIVKLTGNKTEHDLALKEEAPIPPKDIGNEVAASDSAGINADVATEPIADAAHPHRPAPSEAKRNSETDESKPTGGAAGPTTATANADENLQAEKAKANELAQATEVVAEEQPVQNAPADAEKELAFKKESEGINNDDRDQKQGVAAVAPESRAKSAVAISKVIRGRVESVDGVALPGVNVMIKNTNIGTVTDGSGNYRLSVAENDPNLVFTFIGFTSTEVDAGEKTQVNVQMDEDVSQLSEVVVVGYGAENKSDEAPETLEFANPSGGRRAFKQYLEKNIQYPEQALAENIEGKVTIQFTVETSGQISDFKVLKGIGHGCEEEVIRLVKQGPKWNPTKRNTESLRDKVKVRMRFTLPKK
ncbi:MAG TPA: TonB family protein [Chryseolinea sp.]|nr:TonB family protein [Chryseolinea sp.]